MKPDPHPDDLLTATEVAALFAVTPKTVTRWDRDGRLPATLRTLGGHRRWRRSEVTTALTREVHA